jgi:hypothetical protein
MTMMWGFDNSGAFSAFLLRHGLLDGGKAGSATRDMDQLAQMFD